jgi:dienelactone hydrolase
MRNTDQENPYAPMPPRLILSGSIAIAILSLGTCPAFSQHHSTLEAPPARNTIPRLDNTPDLRTYDLGNATLTQPGVSSSWQEMPYSLNGTLGMPQGEGPFPVVVLLHGRHPGCHFVEETNPSPWPCPPGTETRFDQGLAYLAQVLTKAGYLTLAPNLNAAYANAYGATSANRTDLVEVRSEQIIDAHLTGLLEAHRGGSADFGVSLEDKADLEQLAIIGHSLGGGIAVRRARQSLEESAQLFNGDKFSPIRALLLVSPTPSRSVEKEPQAYELPDVPTGVVVGGCDRDIYDLSSLYYFEAANTNPRREGPVAALLVPGANHNFFNAAVQQDDYYRQPDNAPLCDPQQSTLRLSRVEQENFLVDYALKFLDQTLNPENHQSSGAEYGSMLQALLPSDQVSQFMALANIAIPKAQQQVVFSPAETASNPSPPLTSGGLTVTTCSAFQPCREGITRHPQFPEVLHITWAKAGGQLQFPVSPDGKLQDAQSLHLRVAPMPGASDFGTSPGFAVVLRDQSGQAVRVEIPHSTQALRALPADPAQPQSSLAYPSLVNIPIGQFRGVDLSRLTAVDLVFDAGTEGSIYLGEVRFVLE